MKPLGEPAIMPGMKMPPVLFERYVTNHYMDYLKKMNDMDTALQLFRVNPSLWDSRSLPDQYKEIRNKNRVIVYIRKGPGVAIKTPRELACHEVFAYDDAELEERKNTIFQLATSISRMRYPQMYASSLYDPDDLPYGGSDIFDAEKSQQSPRKRSQMRSVYRDATKDDDALERDGYPRRSLSNGINDVPLSEEDWIDEAIKFRYIASKYEKHLLGQVEKLLGGKQQVF